VPFPATDPQAAAFSLLSDPGTTDREFFETEFPNTLTRDGEILACATVRSVFYAAVRTRETGQVWALVVLLHRSRADAGRWDNNKPTNQPTNQPTTATRR
jgi:hypothetical protein